GDAHIILVRRNPAAAILASFPIHSASLSWKHEFVACDASLLRNVHATVAALRPCPDLPWVHFLVLSAG
ncbi:hypothetical protein B0H13DRAFT_1627477, partial [Mycena leptocephala]